MLLLTVQVRPTAVMEAQQTDGEAPLAAAAEPAAAAPVERKPLRAGPSGGAYVPPFKLAQMMREAGVSRRI